MSWTACQECGIAINSDDDPDCFVYIGNYKRQHGEKIMCEACRDLTDIDTDQLWQEETRNQKIARQVAAKMREIDAREPIDDEEESYDT